MPIICQEPAIIHFSAVKMGTNQQKKRLQEELLGLRQALGSDVLRYAPEISVSRIDLFRPLELEKLHDGLVEKVKFREIIKLGVRYRGGVIKMGQRRGGFSPYLLYARRIPPRILAFSTQQGIGYIYKIMEARSLLSSTRWDIPHHQ